MFCASSLSFDFRHIFPLMLLIPCSTPVSWSPRLSILSVTISNPLKYCTRFWSTETSGCGDALDGLSSKSSIRRLFPISLLFREANRPRANCSAGVGACCWIWRGSDWGLWLTSIPSDWSPVEWKSSGAGHLSSGCSKSGRHILRIPPPIDLPHLCPTGSWGLGMPWVLMTMHFLQSRVLQWPRWDSGVPWVLEDRKIPLEGIN